MIEIFTTLHSNPFSDNKQSITIAPIITLFYMLVIGWSLFFTGKFLTANPEIVRNPFFVIIEFVEL